MPQMKPMNWLFLFILTNILMMMINIINYFNINYKLINSMNFKKKKKINWKW